MTDAAYHVADEGFAEIDDASGDACVIHENAGADEEGNGQQRDGLRSGDKALYHEGRIELRVTDKVGGRGSKNGDKDGQTQEQEHQHQHAA